MGYRCDIPGRYGQLSNCGFREVDPPLSEKAPELDGRYVLKEKNEEAN